MSKGFRPQKKVANNVKTKKNVNLKPTATAYLQIFGTGSGDTNPSIFLFADSQRYVFSCGESTQRLFNEHKLKLGKINNIFLTQLKWPFFGGVPGLLLTLREAKKASVNLHGPQGTTDLLLSSKGFLSMGNLDLRITEYVCNGDKGMYKDENILVKAIPIEGEPKKNFSFGSEITKLLQSDDGLKLDRHAKCKSRTDFTNNDVSLRRAKRLKLDIHSRTVVNYVCELVSMPGKMNLKKACELGVPKGPLLGRLQKGEDVVLGNGTKVRSSDVMEKSSAGPIFCIIDCPSMYYLKQLVSNDVLLSCQLYKDNLTPIIMVHLTPGDVVKEPEYKAWLERFGPECQHLFLNEVMCPAKISMLSQLGIQYCLNQLNPRLFPPLFATEKSNHDDLPANWSVGEPYLIYHLRPTTIQGYDRIEISRKWDMLTSKVTERMKCLKSSEEFTLLQMRNALNQFINPEKFVEIAKEKVKTANEKRHTSKESNEMDKELSVVFLGTGASLPSKFRNVSCMLVHLSDEQSILLDCGEGSYGQLYRHYGPNLHKVLLQLCCIFISHMHADHHLGLISVLQAWKRCIDSCPREERPEPIVVIAPSFLYDWLHYYGTFCDTLNFRFYDSRKFVAGVQTEADNILSSLLHAKVSIVPVVHCPHAFGLVLSHTKGWKLVYSGDTRPCEALIKEGLDATLVIHEATLEDELYNEAVAKQHSTTSEAIECGQKMKAKFTLLTHFSQRYPKIPIFNTEFNDCVGIAFDHMMVNFDNLSDLPQLLRPLKAIFKEEFDEQKTQDLSTVFK